MRKVSLVFLLTVLPFLSFSQNSITGIIVDELGLPIYRASVEIDLTDDTTYTDYDGAFTLSSEKKFHWKINIKSHGYKPESFFVLDGGKTDALVLEYGDEMKSLLGKKLGLHQKFYWKPSFKFNLFPDSKDYFGVVLNTYK